MAAQRHMHEFGTTPEQLAWIKVAASEHAQHNPHAMLPTPVTVEEVLASPIIASPLHRSEEHTSELQSLMRISYAVFCLKKKNQQTRTSPPTTTIYTQRQI